MTARSTSHPDPESDAGRGRHGPPNRRRRLALVAGAVAVALVAGVGGIEWARHDQIVTSTESACTDPHTAGASVTPGPTASAQPDSGTTVSGTDVDRSSSASRTVLRDMAGIGFSQGYEPQTLSTAKRTALFRGIAATGATSVRVDLNWGDVEPDGPGSYDIDHTLAVYRAAVAQHLAVLPVLNGVPTWAASAPGGCGAAVAAFMRRAAPDILGVGVRVLEVGNEVNTSGMTPRAYTDDMLVPASRAFRQAAIADGVTVAVISTGLAPGRTSGSTYAPPDFLKGVYAAGGGPYFDAVGMHPYSWPAGPDSTASWNWLRGSTEVRSVMVANGDTDKTMWATEYGFPTNSDRGVSDAQQAAFLKLGASIWMSHSWAGGLVLYSYQDLQTGASDPEDNFGVLDSDGKAKPALGVAEQLAADAKARSEN